MRELAASGDFVVAHEYEVTYLCRRGRPKVIIGDFYGDPGAAVIDPQGHWCVVVGEGIVVYFLNEPFEPYRRGRTSSQWRDYFRKDDLRFFEAVYLASNGAVRAVADPYQEGPVLYELEPIAGTVESLR